jgi:hypothetical protein
MPTKRKTSIALLAAVAAVHVACSYSRRLIGRVTADDGNTGVACAATVFQGTFEEDRCRLAGSDPFDQVTAIPLGERFTCSVSANKDELYELQVNCPGYRPLVREVPLEGCAGSWFGGCDDVDLGALVVARIR